MKQDLGRIRGSLSYIGDGITGASTTDTIFENSGISFAYEEDMYLHLSRSEDNGNVYKCTKKGTPDVATWVYCGSLLGPQPVLINSLDSDETTKALTAKMGKRLSEKLDGAGIYPHAIIPSYIGATSTISLTLENKDTTIELIDRDGFHYFYYFKAEETTEEFAKVDISISPELGFDGFSAYIVEITSDVAAFAKYKLVNSSAQTVEEETLSIWDSLTNALQVTKRNTGFVDGDNTYYTGIVKAFTNSKLDMVYPVSHVEAIYYSIENQKTLKKYLEELEAEVVDLDARVKELERK